MRSCQHPGCPALINGGYEVYCARHRQPGLWDEHCDAPGCASRSVHGYLFCDRHLPRAGSSGRSDAGPSYGSSAIRDQGCAQRDCRNPRTGRSSYCISHMSSRRDGRYDPVPAPSRYMCIYCGTRERAGGRQTCTACSPLPASSRRCRSCETRLGEGYSRDYCERCLCQVCGVNPASGGSYRCRTCAWNYRS